MTQIPDDTTTHQSLWPEMFYFPPPTDEQVDELLRQLKPEVVTGSLADLFRDDYRKIIRNWLANL